MASSTPLQTMPVASAVRSLTLEKAKDLVFQLGVPLNVLDNIEARYNGEDRKFHFIQQWLDSDVSASWEKLASALERIGMSVLAAEIRQKIAQEPTMAAPAQSEPTICTIPGGSSEGFSSEPVELTPKCFSAPVVPTTSSSQAPFTASAPNFSTPHPPTSTTVLTNVPNQPNHISYQTSTTPLTPASSSTVSESTSHPATHTPVTTSFVSSTDSQAFTSNSTLDLVTDAQTRDPSVLEASSPSRQPQSLTTDVQLRDSASIVSVAPTPTPPTTATLATPTQSEPVDQERVAQVKADIEGFKDKFTDLIVDAQMSWFERQAQEQTFFLKFRCYLLALPVSKKASHIKLFQQHRKEILQAKDIDVICDFLSQYSNYTNYEIILHLVKKFCGDKLKTRMIGYRDSFEAFEMGTTIDVYLCAISASSDSELRAGFVKMAMKINKPASACTLHEIRQLRECIAENASLHSYSMYIEPPTEGSVVATFRVPSHCIWFLARAVTPEFTHESGLVDVVLAGQDVTYWQTTAARSTWITRGSQDTMKEYVTAGADGQYLQGRDYDTTRFLSGSGTSGRDFSTGKEYVTDAADGQYLQGRDYDTTRFLSGSGTSGRDFSTGKMFVIKSGWYDSVEMMEGLMNESHVLSKIPPHDNITTFIGAMLEERLMEDDRVLQKCHIFTELAENGNLASMIEAAQDGEMGSTLSVDQSIFYLHQILLGVAYLRSLHIFHLNITSENILVLAGGRRLKLANFEKALHFEDIPKFAKHHLTGVSPHFSAPEVIRRNEPSPYSDVWSSVCVFIHLVTGCLPGHHTGLISRHSMREMLMSYSDGDIEKLVPLSEMELDSEVVSIFRDGLCEDCVVSRPSALALLKYPALKNADMYEHNFPAMPQRESELEPTKLRHSPSEMMLPRRLVKESDLPRQAGSIMLHKKVRSWYRGSKTPVTRKGEQRAASPPHHSIQPSPMLLSSSLSLLDVVVTDSSPYSYPVSERIPRHRRHHRRSQEPPPPAGESSRTSSIRSLRRHCSQPQLMARPAPILPSSPRTSVTAHSLPPQESDAPKDGSQVPLSTETTAVSKVTTKKTRLPAKSKPTLLHLMFFPSNEGEVNIIGKVGCKYHEFGIILLNDDDGSQIDTIESKFGDLYRINQKILKIWLQGRDEGPVTWTTLVKVLKTIGLGSLAHTIESSLSY